MTDLEFIQLLLLEVPHFDDTFVVTLLMVVISVAALCGLALVSAVLLKRRPALRHSVLLSGLIAVGLIPIFIVLVNVMPVPRLQVTVPLPEVPEIKVQLNNPTDAEVAAAKAAAAEAKARIFDGRIEDVIIMRGVDPGPGGFPIDVTPPRAPQWRRPIWLRLIVKAAYLLWPMGSFLLLLRFAIAWLRVAIIRQTSRPLPEQPYRGTLTDVMRVMNLRRLPRVRVSSRVRMPVVAGLFRPQIILPESLPSSLTQDEFQQVLIHETAHAIRHDLWVVHWEAMALILFWPIVLVGLMVRELSRTREELCDLYVSKIRDRHDYGQTLLKVARIANRVRPLPLATGVLYGPGQLESRVATLLDDRRDESTRLSWKWAAGMLAPFLLLTSAACSTHLVAYDPPVETKSELLARGVPNGSAPSPLLEAPDAYSEGNFDDSVMLTAPVRDKTHPDADEAAAIENLEAFGVNVERSVWRSSVKETVYFDEKSTVNSEVFRLVTSLKDLWKLEFQCLGPAAGPAMTDASMKELSELGNLAHLSFKNTAISEAGLRELRHLAHLVTLEIEFTKLSGIGLEELAAIENLMKISLHSTTIQDECLRGVEKFKNLVELRLSVTNVTDAGLKELSGHPNLKYLYLSSTQTTNAGLADVAKIKTLTELSLDNNQITDEGLKELSGLQNLERLWIGFTPVTDAGLKDLSPLKNLKWLVANETPITGTGLKDLKELQNLTRLNLEGGEVTDAGLEGIGELKNLTELLLANTKITGVGLKHLNGLKNLVHLDLNSTEISDQGLEGLRGLKNIKRLKLSGTQITDAGLKGLAEFKNLKSVDLTKTKVTDAGVKQLQSALSQTKISH